MAAERHGRWRGADQARGGGEGLAATGATRATLAARGLFTFAMRSAQLLLPVASFQFLVASRRKSCRPAPPLSRLSRQQTR